MPQTPKWGRRKEQHSGRSDHDLNSRKPSQLLQYILQHLERDIKEIFLKRLASNIRPVLAAHKNNITVEELAELDDNIIELSDDKKINAIQKVEDHSKKLQTVVRRLPKLKYYGKRQHGYLYYVWPYFHLLDFG
ncbi:unnamed protein product [Psylliodes chrysocephalus]|uniref:Uncharacterized protein n=1 Tax=Psylliodes chrysocephalus TaxID=3402493 RepID=A0A9P0CLG5_9CUCU|nr:unnamed protein product [Psylliodes chrysocephala]